VKAYRLGIHATLAYPGSRGKWPIREMVAVVVYSSVQGDRFFGKPKNVGEI